MLYYYNGVLLFFRQFCIRISSYNSFKLYLVVQRIMPFQYVQKTSPEANTDNRKIRENWCACMCTISCAPNPNLNPCALCTGSIRAQCARCARVKACTDSSEKKVEVCQCIGSFLLIQLPVKARSFSCFPVDLLKNWILLYDMNKKEVQSLI